MTNYTTTIGVNEFKLSLSRTGGQGSKGDSVTSADTRGGELIFTITRADGTTYESNAGAIGGAFSLHNLGDVTLNTEADGDVLIYDSAAQEWANHQLTTSKVLDIDNTNKEDGAVLVYDNTASKYQATNRIEKQTTHIIGGSF
jgi:hypothetical protein